MFALVPLALLGVRRRPVQLLLAIAAVLSVPWWLNAGSRFLLPTLPFLALALLAVVPRKAALAVVFAHAIVSWPQVVALYAPQGMYLDRFPVRAALGLESQEEYLRKSWDYCVAKMVERNTARQDRVLDFHGVQQAHVDREIDIWWQSSVGDGLVRSLGFMLVPGLYRSDASFPSQVLRGVRVRQTGTSHEWSIPEIEFYAGDARVRASRRWSLDAAPNRWETPLAFDRNFASRWITWEPARPGMWFAVDFEGTETISGVRVYGTRREAGSRVEIEVQRADGSWQTVAAQESPHSVPNLPRQAINYVKRLGYTHIVAETGSGGMEKLGETIVKHGRDWGADVVDHHDNIYLLRLR
jgi:hypothetical protein